MNPADCPPKFTKLIAVLAVQDHKKSSEFYIDKLGFTADHVSDEWIMLQRDGARIHLGNCPDEKPASETGLHNWFATILVDNIYALEKEFSDKGVTFMRDLKDNGDDWIDFVVQTPDGHRLVFGHLKK